MRDHVRVCATFYEEATKLSPEALDAAIKQYIVKESKGRVTDLRISKNWNAMSISFKKTVRDYTETTKSEFTLCFYKNGASLKESYASYKVGEVHEAYSGSCSVIINKGILDNPDSCPPYFLESMAKSLTQVLSSSPAPTTTAVTTTLEVKAIPQESTAVSNPFTMFISDSVTERNLKQLDSSCCIADTAVCPPVCIPKMK